MVFISSESIAKVRTSVDIDESMAIAALGPIPLTVIKSLKKSRSSFSRKPKSCIASSLMCR